MARARKAIPVAPLLKALADKKIRPAAFAKKIGVSDQVLSNWKKRGAIPESEVRRVAGLIGKTFDQYVREAGRGELAEQPPAQYSFERSTLLEDYDHLPTWLQEHIARKVRELRAYAEALPDYVREGMKGPPKDPDAYRAWEKGIENDMDGRLGRNTK